MTNKAPRAYESGSGTGFSLGPEQNVFTGADLAARSSFDVVYTSPAGGTVAGDHIVSEASIAQAYDLKEPDTVILAEIEMLSKTFAGNVIGIQADLHYQTDREATIGKRPDFNVAD